MLLYGTSDDRSAALTLLDFVGHENAAVSSYLGVPDDVDADLATLVDLVADGRLVPHIGFRDDWEHINDALDALSQGRVDGKAVLTVT